MLKHREHDLVTFASRDVVMLMVIEKGITYLAENTYLSHDGPVHATTWYSRRESLVKFTLF